MLTTLAIENYRSIHHLVTPLGRLNVVSGPNASGKSNVYRALRLLASAAAGTVGSALAREGGIQSTMWAGPEKISRSMHSGDVPVQGVVRRDAARLRLGFGGEDFGYAITLGYPAPSISAFSLDPEIKTEAIWGGAICRPASTLVMRDRALLRVRERKSWKIVSKDLPPFESMFSMLSDPESSPEAQQLRHTILQWRFYDHFRTDVDAPARIPQIGTRTPVLAHDGSDVAAAIQTILEIGDAGALEEAVTDAFPDSVLHVAVNDGRFVLEFAQHGLLRPLTAAELSDGTLRYFLLIAALLTPRPPALMVLNEPETSLHPDLLPALGRLIIRASSESQVWVVTHSTRLIASLEEDPGCNSMVLDKSNGETTIAGQRPLEEPPWYWPE